MAYYKSYCEVTPEGRELTTKYEEIRWHHRIFDVITWLFEKLCAWTTHWWGHCAIIELNLSGVLWWLTERGTYTTYRTVWKDDERP